METSYVVGIDKCDGYTVAVGTGCTSNAMHVVLGIMGHVVVDHHAYVVNIYTSGYDVSSYKNILLSALKLIHHLVALLLCKVAMHRAAVHLHLL